ncbi:FAD-dependent oxidoreductase [Arthrobacter sp. GCM10027362]|uniref:FAD-dependent oxidoreductase n=1 Tax=Arthrobacter sp. GCM10027362 TaxID=3273379 RepID=UPI00363A455F
MVSLWLDSAPQIPSDPFTAEAGYDTVVVGAGLTGLGTAVLLARAGHRVAVLEARSTGAVTTGNTTAKVSLLQGRKLSRILAHHSPQAVRSYVAAQREAQDWLLGFCAEHAVAFQHRDAYSYATTDKGAETLRAELHACTVAGLDVELNSAAAELPFAVTGALKLAHQAQIHPMHVLAALVRELRTHGGVLAERVRATDVRSKHDATGRRLSVHTDTGRVGADNVVLATGIPFLNRGGHFSVLKPQRSYAVAFQTAGPVPAGMYLSVDTPTRSLRSAGHNDRELLIVGGNGHVVGRKEHPKEQFEDLVRWTRSTFPGAEPTHSWSAQDYEPAGALPYVGRLSPSDQWIQTATGFDKWGMTNAIAAALALSGQILDGRPEWAQDLYKVRISPTDAASTVETNAAVGARMAIGWAEAMVQSAGSPPPEGQGVVYRSHGKPAGVSTVGGVTRRVSAVCTHLGGILEWNDAECSWDCPLHGSRFSPEGSRLEGPAVRDLGAPEAGAG